MPARLLGAQKTTLAQLRRFYRRFIDLPPSPIILSVGES
jgi:hypothetical protein